ncbi:lactate 2-monooxygenase [Tautonia plasticadhaerens]|uniref:Lactate 2-monooxygenase n=1 Tax=Tautonia plasticadhaerens TaxID=2527974 RepID=A0A518H1D0_9BACT|nr:lactate 2-monooxygenase [Tautonia plasticadhaerens]QDV34649.1 Lactate 2-monooxygenase [Tautonia plasticadhaerens]
MTESNPLLSPGIKRQFQIYEAGLQGRAPAHPISVDELARRAEEVLAPEAFGYLAGGAGAEETMRSNREAFRRRRIVPRMLRDVSRRDTGVEVLGMRLPAPLMLAPIGVQSILHEQAELAVARAAAALGVPMILSTASSRTIEEVAAAMGDAPRWFQLYWPRSDELAASFLRRAEAAGYRAVVVTLDTYLLSWRERDLQHAYLPFLRGEGVANYYSDPVFRAEAGVDPVREPGRAFEHFAHVFSDPSRTWADLARLREATRLPILLKGVLHPDDARRAVDQGAAGVVVSNHGGRQLDGAVAALDALPGVVDAVGDRAAVLFDGGIRRGADVLKAMALGARCVLLGRPYCYGLAVGGEQGVRDVLANLEADIDLTLGLSGCASFAELGRGHLVESRSDPSATVP